MTFEINDNNISARVSGANEFAVFTVAEQALADCNFYCKEDTDTLIKSSVIHTDAAVGELHWVTPYANYQYFLPNTRTDKNPHACPRWCEAAHDNHGDQWETTFYNAFNRGLMR